jgi:NAD(P)H dehydrogenase (quinone)
MCRSGRWLGTLLALSAVAAFALPLSGQERIIVTGASGQLGSRVVEELLERGVDPADLILVSRTTETLAQYAAMGASVRYGDFTEPESLPAAYAGGTRMLLISMNPHPERPELHRNAIRAGVDAGVRHIVYTSTVDVGNMGEAPSAADHRRTEQYIMESGATWTMLRHQLYADGLVNLAARMIADRRALVQPDEVPTAFVTRDDCAAAAAAVLTTAGHENQAYDITGPEAVLRREIAAMAREIAGVPIAIELGPGGLEQAPGPMAGYASFRTTSDHVERLTGRPATSVRQLLEANREALLEAAR